MDLWDLWDLWDNRGPSSSGKRSRMIMARSCVTSQKTHSVAAWMLASVATRAGAAEGSARVGTLENRAESYRGSHKIPSGKLT